MLQPQASDDHDVDIEHHALPFREKEKDKRWLLEQLGVAFSTYLVIVSTAFFVSFLITPSYGIAGVFEDPQCLKALQYCADCGTFTFQ